MSQASTGNGGGLRLDNEFASVSIQVDSSANGPRLKVVDRHSGHCSYLDPLELQALVHARHEDLAFLLDPGSTRWAGPTEMDLSPSALEGI